VTKTYEADDGRSWLLRYQVSRQNSAKLHLLCSPDCAREKDSANVGLFDGKVSISGPNLVAEGVGRVAVGQPRLMYVANANCAFPLWPAAPVDVSATHFGTAPESVDNGIYPPQVTQMNFGGRYNFTAYGRKSSLRVQIQNIPATNEWTSQYTPGFFQWPAPRTVFAYITTDLQ
jgi:hypothetical protein